MGFFRGTFYNRCTRGHELLATAMEALLFEKFVTTLSEEDKTLFDELASSVPNTINEQKSFYRSNPTFLKFGAMYDRFFNQVLTGSLKETAQYWCQYIYFINRLYRELVRTNDAAGYIKILPAVTDVFFILHRPNYARWTTLFRTKLETASADTLALLKNGAFSIRRSNNNFSRCAVDITLEQTVNRTAASPAKGIINFTNNRDAILRWTVTANQRGMLSKMVTLTSDRVA